MTLQQRLLLHCAELWRALFAWIPGGPGVMARRLAFGPLFGRAGRFRCGVGVAIQGFGNISFGRNVGFNRYSSLYAARGVISLGSNVFLGDFSSINANDAQIRIGNNVAIGPMCIIQGANHNFDDLTKPIVDQGHTQGQVIIEDNVWIAAHCTILPGAHLESGCVIAAGAVVRGRIPANSVAGGVPAKIIRERGRV